MMPILKAIEDGSAWEPFVVNTMYLPFLVDLDNILDEMH